MQRPAGAREREGGVRAAATNRRRPNVPLGCALRRQRVSRCGHIRPPHLRRAFGHAGGNAGGALARLSARAMTACGWVGSSVEGECCFGSFDHFRRQTFDFLDRFTVTPVRVRVESHRSLPVDPENLSESLPADGRCGDALDVFISVGEVLQVPQRRYGQIETGCTGDRGDCVELCSDLCHLSRASRFQMPRCGPGR